MLISDIAVKRPVFASVLSLLLLLFGLVAYDQLPLREYPDIDPPIVTVDVSYPGAPANIVETRVTQILEDRIAGIDGIQYIDARSSDGRSSVTIEFSTSRNIQDAANDVRDKIARIRDDLPAEALAPDVQKADSNEDVIVWQNLVSDRMTVPELTDYADRFLVNEYASLDGVARVRVGGGLRYALRVWLDSKALGRLQVTSEDIVSAIRGANLESPAGSLETEQQLLKLRVTKPFVTPEDFENLVVGRTEENDLIYLRNVARIEKGVEEDRILFRGNGIPMVGLGVIRQSNANVIDVARSVRETSERLQSTLPVGMSIEQSYDASVFVEESIKEVFKTFAFALICVIIVIFGFLGQWRLVLIPAVAVPVSVVASFIVLAALGLSINLLTLLALVLAIGLVVDDAIVVLENIYRRVTQFNEKPFEAALNGAREVGFAVIATTLVLVAMFIPMTFMQGYLGQLFSEFAFALSAAVLFSSLIALTLTPVLCSKIMRQDRRESKVLSVVQSLMTRLTNGYQLALEWILNRKFLVLALFIATIGAAGWMYNQVPQMLTPKEDRGAFFVIVNGPEGSSYEYIEEKMGIIEERLMPYVEAGEFSRLLVRAPRGFDGIENFNSGIVIVVLEHWSERRPAWPMINEVRTLLSDLPGITAFPVMRQGLGGRTEKPVQFVIGGPDYDTLDEWQQLIQNKIEENNPGFLAVEVDYKPTRPQMDIDINYAKAADLGITPAQIGNTLETLYAGRRVTTWNDKGEEYDVYIQGERQLQKSIADLKAVYVRSPVLDELVPLAGLVTAKTYGAAEQLSRYNKVRAVTISADLTDELSLPEALEHLRGLVKSHLPVEASIDYKGASLDLEKASDQVMFVFLVGLLVVFLVLAAQFESFVHPWTILLTVPLAMLGGFLGLYITGGSLNIYSQIGLIMLVGLAAKNGILIVEFANQLRQKGAMVREAVLEASAQRLRPILMTSLTTLAGAIPLIFATGAGAETRVEIGIVVFFGVLLSSFFTLFMIPVAYLSLTRESKGQTAAVESTVVK